MNKKIFSLILFSFLIFFSFDSFAMTVRSLELVYPTIRGGDAPEYVNTELPEYISYIFNFAIGISGILALIFIIIGGFKYSTSSGNPDKIRDARSTITSALIGLLILFGSWLVLYTINPNLIDLKIQRLSPIISELPEGVIVCKQEVEVAEAFAHAHNFYQVDTYSEKVMIKQELDLILEEINKHCYVVEGAGNVRASFNNNITDIYLVPGVQEIAGTNYLSHYGAVLYAGSNFEGSSHIVHEHLNPWGSNRAWSSGVHTPIHIEGGVDFNTSISSIRLFVIKPVTEQADWNAALYQKYNRNQGVLNPDGSRLEGYEISVPDSVWYLGGDGYINVFSTLDQTECESDWCIIRSLEVKGEYILILTTPDSKSDVFYNEIDNNLDDNPNLITWVNCPWYFLYVKACAEPRISSALLIRAIMY